MLLSLSHKFIFVANLKSASSAIERAIGPSAEFRVSQTGFGKHDDLTTISRKFRWVKKYIGFDEFFVFGVMREPVDFLLSLYNFHTAAGFDEKRHSTKNLTFDEFLNGWCRRSWQARPQHFRFADSHGFLQTNHVVDFAQLDTEFPKLCAKLGLKAKLQRVNISPTVLARKDLTQEQITTIRSRYEPDYAFLRQRPRAI